MNIKPSYRIVIGLLVVIVFLVVLSLNTGNMTNLFSRSIDTFVTATGDDPRPAVESLDSQKSEEEVPIDREKLLQELQRELLQTQNDPDKALKIRRKIQALHVENEASASVTVENN